MGTLYLRSATALYRAVGEPQGSLHVYRTALDGDALVVEQEVDPRDAGEEVLRLAAGGVLTVCSRSDYLAALKGLLDQKV